MSDVLYHILKGWRQHTFSKSNIVVRFFGLVHVFLYNKNRFSLGCLDQCIGFENSPDEGSGLTVIGFAEKNEWRPYACAYVLWPQECVSTDGTI